MCVKGAGCATILYRDAGIQLPGTLAGVLCRAGAQPTSKDLYYTLGFGSLAPFSVSMTAVSCVLQH